MDHPVPAIPYSQTLILTRNIHPSWSQMNKYNDILHFFHFEGQTDFGLGDSFWVPLQGKGQCEFFLKPSWNSFKRSQTKDFLKTTDQPAFF